MAQVQNITAKDALQRFVDTLNVHVPKSGIFKGKMILSFQISPTDPESYYVLSVAKNSYDEASLNSIWGALNQAREVLGIPQVMQ